MRRGRIRSKILANTIKVPNERMESDCWIWLGANSGSGRGGGYPRMSLDGQTVAVHKVMFVNENGFVPGKKQIDHLCGCRMCVNPNHLEMVTHRTNQRRRVEADRIRKTS